MPQVTAQEWASFLEGFPDAHLLQTPLWGELKTAFGWQAAYLIYGSQGQQIGAQILFHPLPLGFRLAYIPKGPVGSSPWKQDEPAWSHFWAEADQLCREKRAIFLKVEPDMWETSCGAGQAPETRQALLPPGFRKSAHTIQPPRTLVVDLGGDEEEVLGRMKPKTRYNIRLALKKGVVTQPSADLDTFYRLMVVTSQRDGFGVHSLAYYRKAYELFYPPGACELLMAEFQGDSLAGLMVFAHGKRAWFLFGGSTNDHRDRMPNYLIQWEAMRWARSHGITEYDLWGVPDEEEETLESRFTKHAEGLWGVYRFKRGFGGKLRRAAGPWDRVYQPFLYAFYEWWAKHREVAG